MRLRELVSIEQAKNLSAAIRLDLGLASQAEALVERFTPTQSAITILNNLQEAVLPGAPVQKRAMIWHGIYGSGKSHLGVLAAHLLQDGAQTAAFQSFRQKLDALGHAQLARQLDSSFVASEHRYLIVTLYGSADGSSLQSALLEALHSTLSRHENLDVNRIMPTTEYEAAYQRFQTIISHQAEWADTGLEKWKIPTHDFLTTREMAEGLKRRAPEALETFKQWHIKVNHGSTFNPTAEGGKNVVEAFNEACRNLVQQHDYAGIAIIWDEFGYALENLMKSAHRNVIEEVFKLQEFVDSLCDASRISTDGHILFMGLTHRTLSEYGIAAEASKDIQQRLNTIQGRYGQFRVELKATEQEGYHLLGSLTQLTTEGERYLNQGEQPRLLELISACANLQAFSLFKHEDLKHVSYLCYPLHPLTAAALFVIASRGNYSEANRTVFTFFSDIEKQTQGRAFEREADIHCLYSQELIRLPELLTVYADPIEKEMPVHMDMYRDIEAKVKASTENVESRGDVLKILMLGRILGDNFQATEKFLAVALYDAEPGNAKATPLQLDLDWLRKTGYVYKNDLTEVWELESGGTSEVEPQIQEQMKQVGAGQGTYALLNTHPDMRDDLLPHLDIHELEPSPAGIVRSYAVRLVDTPINPQQLRIENDCLSAQIFLTLPPDATQAETTRQVCRQILEPDGRLIFVWVPTQGTKELNEGLRRYVAIDLLLKQSGIGDGVRRRLLIEWEKNRKALIKQLSERFGKDGLQQGKAKIFTAGDSENSLDCRSWHEFRELLAHRINALYPQEIAVRAMSMNVNRLYAENTRKLQNFENLLEDILHFEDLQPAKRNDLLGERETSERAAVVDGILGEYANQLFIKRADGWAIKSFDEISEPAKSVVKLIYDKLTFKREKPYEVSKLRKILINPPYGIPPTAMPVLTAVALRGEVKRLKWTNDRKAFHAALAQAFDAGSNAQIRREDFNKKQLNALKALAKVLEYPGNPDLDENEEAREIIQALRKKISSYPEHVKNHSKLNDNARQLVSLFTVVGKTPHDIVDFLLNLPGVREGLADSLELSVYPDVQSIFRELLGEFEKILDEKRNEIRSVIYTLPENLEEREKLVAGLRLHQQESIAKVIEQNQATDDMVTALVEAIANKKTEECDDIEIGKISTRLDSIIKEAQKPVAPPPEITVTPPPVDKENPEDSLFIALQQVIDGYKNTLDTAHVLKVMSKLQTQLQQTSDN